MNLTTEQIQAILDGAPEQADFYADYFGYFTCNPSGVWMYYNPSGFSGAKWFRFCELRMESMKPMHRLDDLREILTLRQEVERLRIACQLGIDMFVANEINVPNTIETMQDAIEATPQANLNHVKREVYRDGYSSGWKHSLGTKAEDGNHYACGERLAVQLSAQLYPDKE